MKIAYLGDTCSNSYLAACKFGASQPTSYKTIGEAVRAVEEGVCDAAAVPVENSIEGAVGESLDVLTSSPVYITAETVLPIEHCLIGLPQAKLSDITAVYSHPQALAQCRAYLAQHKLSSIAVASTSEGLQKITDVHTAAIARIPREGQAVIEAHIEDYPHNATRFVLLKRTPTFAGGKVSIVFETVNAPGALLKALTVIADFGLNMVHIESRPNKRVPGRYIFFVDLQYDGDKTRLLELFDVLSRETGMLKFLGRYDTFQ